MMRPLIRLRSNIRHWLERAARARPGPQLRRRLSLLAGGLFVGSFVVAWQHMPDVELQSGWLVAAAILAASVVGVNILEFRLAAGISGRRVPWSRCVRVVLWGSATNLLPLPGSFLVRTQAIAGRVGWRGSARVMLAPAMAWLGCAFGASGAALLALGRHMPAVVLLSMGVLAVLGLWSLLPSPRKTTGWMIRFLALECLFVALSAGRLFALFAALSVTAGPAHVLVLTSASALAAAAGVLPSGIGLTELLAGGLASLAGISAAAGVVVTSLNRLVGVTVLAVFSGSQWLVASLTKPRAAER